MKLKNVFKYTKDLIQSTIYKVFCKKPNVMSDYQTLEYILNNKCSIARYGDGELRLMRGVDLEFQVYNKELSDKLKNVQNTKQCLLCIPSIFDKSIFNREILVDSEFYYWKKFKRNRGGLWHYYFGKRGLMGDAFVSRFYLRKRDKTKVQAYVDKFKQVWEDRNIIIVEGETSKVGVDNDILDNAKSVRRILCPNIDAFKYYHKILESVKENYQEGDLIILALGPTATVLAYDLSLLNMQALDLGHFDIEYEWFLAKTETKISVKNKHVNECNDLGVVESTNKKYLKEIIERIGEKE